MKIIKRGNSPLAQTSRVECKSCESVLEVNSGEWKRGTYGSEMVIKCPVCKSEVVRPGTEYTGDF